MNLNLIKLTQCYLPKAVLQQASAYFFKNLKISNKTELVVVFVDKKKSKELNFKFRKKNKPTDILSFASIESSCLGELVICMDIIKLQSMNNKITQKEEVAYMLLHGILHLMGYDHQKKVEAIKMFEIQDKLFVKYLRWQENK